MSDKRYLSKEYANALETKDCFLHLLIYYLFNLDSR